jgi:hypothetical protein
VAAESNGKPSEEQVLRATAEERKAILDRYLPSTAKPYRLIICTEAGCHLVTEEPHTSRP